MRELGFYHCKTKRAARGGDWSVTDDGIDLVNCEPFQIQAKRLKEYVPVSTICEVKTPIRGLNGLKDIPVVVTKKDRGEAMAILPWEDLKWLISIYLDKGG